MSQRFFRPVFRNIATALCLLAGVSATNAQTNNAIVLDGTDDYIEFPNSALFNTTTTVKAMECWVRFTSFASGFKEIISKSTNSNGMELVVSNLNLSYFLMRDGSNSRYLNYPTTNLVVNTWYHIVGTWDGSDYNSARLYVNGVSVGGTVLGVGTLTAGIGNPGTLRVGQWSDLGENRALNAQVDEVRIWSVYRQAAEVKRDMYANLPGSTPNLIAYYKLNETSGTTVTNLTGNAGLDGTIINGATRAASPVQFGHNGIDLDGVDDVVFAPANSQYNFTTANVGTIEFMVKPRNLTAINGLIVGLRNENVATKVSIHMSNTQVGIWNGTTAEWYNYTFLNQWYHLAFVSNGATTALYINGALVNTYTIPFGTAINMPLTMGKIPSSVTEIFTGSLDEVRIWNGTRTGAQILNFKDVTLTGTESGLVGLYTFDQGIANGTNTALTNVIDKSPTSNTAGVYNFGLTSTTSNYVAGALNIILPVTLSSFTVAKNNQTTVINWQTATESNSKTFVIERSANGADFSQIGSVDAAGNSTELRSYSFTDALPLAGRNYYRLRSVDLDGAFNYSATRLVDFSLASKLSWYSADGKTIDIRWTGSTPVNYQLADISGHVVEKGIIQGGNKQLKDLKPGMYVLSLDNTSVPAIPFIVR